MDNSESTVGKWEPNKEYLDTLTSMGIDSTTAHEALFCTSNSSVEEAINYVFSNAVKGPKISESSGTSSADTDEDAKQYKMTFVVNSSLKMGAGKLAAQVAHAALGLYRHMTDRAIMQESLYCWEYYGEKKIVLKGADHSHLQELYEKATNSNIPCYLIRDAGKTQIPPNSVTVLSLFGIESDVDTITGQLSLL